MKWKKRWSCNIGCTMQVHCSISTTTISIFTALQYACDKYYFQCLQCDSKAVSTRNFKNYLSTKGGNCDAFAIWWLPDVALVVLRWFQLNLYCACADTATSEHPIKILTSPLDSRTPIPKGHQHHYFGDLTKISRWSIWMKFGNSMQYDMSITIIRPKWKPEIKFQYGGRLFSKTRSSNISAVDWDISWRFAIVSSHDSL